MKKILFSGGHLTPALAVIDAIKNSIHKADSEIVYVGRKFVLDTEKTLSLEYKIIETTGIKFIPIQAGRITRLISVRSLRNILKIPVGFFQALTILKNEKPAIILSFGGYIGVPIALVGSLLKIPIITHEQTLRPGLANRIIGRVARKIFVSFEESKRFFPEKKTRVSGNPLRRSIFMVKKQPFVFKKDRPVVYVTGGSLGSHSLNLHIRAIINDLLKKYIVIHQVGDTKEYHDFENLEAFRSNLPATLKNRYFLRKHIFDDEIGSVFSLADIVVSRAGANIFFELIHLAKPAVLIPLPRSANHEQQEQANYFKRRGYGEIFAQSDASNHLLELIEKTAGNRESYKKHFQENSAASARLKTADQIIIDEIFSK